MKIIICDKSLAKVGVSRIIPFLLTIMVGSICNAQDVVRWKFYAAKISAKTFEIHLKATIDEAWHIYSQTTSTGGPLPTNISFAKNPLVLLSEKTKEIGDLKFHHDEIFDLDVYSFTDSVDFVQTINLKTNIKTNLSGTIEYMACTKQKCLTPQKIKFSVKVE